MNCILNGLYRLKNHKQKENKFFVPSKSCFIDLLLIIQETE